MWMIKKNTMSIVTEMDILAGFITFWNISSWTQRPHLLTESRINTSYVLIKMGKSLIGIG